VDKKNTFRHFENTVSSITQRSQTAFDISNQLHLNNEDAINTNSFVYRPQVNQFETLSNQSLLASAKYQGKTNAIPFVQLNLVDNISNKMKSP
jgi:hypothetical protein